MDVKTNCFTYGSCSFDHGFTNILKEMLIINGKAELHHIVRRAKGLVAVIKLLARNGEYS